MTYFPKFFAALSLATLAACGENNSAAFGGITEPNIPAKPGGTGCGQTGEGGFFLTPAPDKDGNWIATGSVRKRLVSINRDGTLDVTYLCSPRTVTVNAPTWTYQQVKAYLEDFWTR